MKDSETVVIRFADEGDAEAVLRMARELAAAVRDPPPQTDTEAFKAIAFGPDRWCDCLVADEDGRLLGYARLPRLRGPYRPAPPVDR